MTDTDEPHRAWYQRVRSEAAFRPRMISGGPNDRLAGLEPLLALARGARILDIGCHKGIVAYEFAKAGAHLILGFDHSSAAVDVATELHSEFAEPHQFEVLDLRGGSAALDGVLAKHTQQDFDIVLYLGIQHHLERQMPLADLDALVLSLAARATAFFAVRTPSENMPRVDALLHKAGFALKVASDLNGNVAPLHIYARELLALQKDSKNCAGRDSKDQGLPDPNAEQQFRNLQTWITQSDVCFLSISKSGRTWVRYFLHAYFGALSDTEFDMRPRTMPSTAFSPSICFSADYLDFYEFKPGVPRIVLGPEMLGRPLVLMVRDPRDVIISYYHYVKAFSPANFLRLVPTGTFADFIVSPILGLETISAFHNIELDFFERHPGPKHLMFYETLYKHPSSGFAALVRFLCNNQVQVDPFVKALDSSRFDAMQEFEISINKANRAREFLRLGIPDWNGDPNALKVRKGGSGGFVEVMPELADEVRLASQFPTCLSVLQRMRNSTWQ